MFGGTYFGRSYFGGRYFGQGSDAVVLPLKDLRKALRARLLADSDILAALGGNHVYPVKLPQGHRRPGIVYKRMPGPAEDFHMAGASGFRTTNVQIDCYAEDADAAVQIGRRVKASINGFAGVFPYGVPELELRVRGVFIASSGTTFDTNSRLHLSRTDYRIVWAER